MEINKNGRKLFHLLYPHRSFCDLNGDDQRKWERAAKEFREWLKKK